MLAVRFTTLLLVSALLWAAGCAQADRTTPHSGTVARVIDGDSFVLRTSTGEKVEVRLTGIDAPEYDQAYARESKQALTALISSRPLTISADGVDRYQRTLACPVYARVDVCLEMVRGGFAWAYHGKSPRRALQWAEQSARDRRVGLWALPPEQVMPPWEWRRRPRNDAAKPAGCTIKGNISRSGKRIYHLPGQRHYEQTAISIANGERWFCTEDQALSAGWRRSRR